MKRLITIMIVVSLITFTATSAQAVPAVPLPVIEIGVCLPIFVAAVIGFGVVNIVCDQSTDTDVTRFKHHLKRQRVNKYKHTRPDINSYKHLRIFSCRD